jgi:hypothetical protein
MQLMTDDKNADKFFEDETGAHILVPEGETVESVVDDIHKSEHPEELVVEAPDGKVSDLMARALEDKVTAEEREIDPPQELLTVAPLQVVPPESPLYSPGDLVGYAEARAGNVVIEDGMPMRMIVDLDNSQAGRSLKNLLTNDRVLALSIFEAPVEDDSSEPSLEDDIRSVLNRHSAENESGTPDYILAEYLITVLEAYNSAISSRAEHRGTPLDRFGYEKGQNTLFPDASSDITVNLQ